MPKRRSGSRIYWRGRGGEKRAYGDFRDFADEGRNLRLISGGFGTT